MRKRFFKTSSSKFTEQRQCAVTVAIPMLYASHFSYLIFVTAPGSGNDYKRRKLKIRDI
jgi:hypothetical protein